MCIFLVFLLRVNFGVSFNSLVLQIRNEDGHGSGGHDRPGTRIQAGDDFEHWSLWVEIRQWRLRDILLGPRNCCDVYCCRWRCRDCFGAPRFPVSKMLRDEDTRNALSFHKRKVQGAPRRNDGAQYHDASDGVHVSRWSHRDRSQSHDSATSNVPRLEVTVEIAFSSSRWTDRGWSQPDGNIAGPSTLRVWNTFLAVDVDTSQLLLALALSRSHHCIPPPSEALLHDRRLVETVDGINCRGFSWI